MGRSWDWIKAKGLVAVLWLDTGLVRAYRWWARVTPDYIEPFVRVSGMVVVVLLISWAIHTVMEPERVKIVRVEPAPFLSIPTPDRYADVARLEAENARLRGDVEVLTRQIEEARAAKPQPASCEPVVKWKRYCPREKTVMEELGF